MPTLTRLLVVLALLAGAVFAVMWALVTFVRPEIVPITVNVPIPALQERRAPVPPPAPSSAEPASPEPAPPPSNPPRSIPNVEGLR